MEAQPLGLKLVPYNAKIADINEPDNNKHTLDLVAPLSETRAIIAVILVAERIVGGGALYVFPNEGTDGYAALSNSEKVATITIKAGTQRLQYQQGVANDDFDLMCLGYFVE